MPLIYKIILLIYITSGSIGLLTGTINIVKKKGVLKMKSICQNCQKKLTLDISDVMICSYECISFRTYAIEVLNNSCPSCGGCF